MDEKQNYTTTPTKYNIKYNNNCKIEMYLNTAATRSIVFQSSYPFSPSIINPHNYQ